MKKKAVKKEAKKSNSKKKKQEKIEAGNLIEDSSIIFENCIRCGLCKSLCPVFKTLREEVISPRGHAVLLSEKTLEKAIFQCTLCKACEIKCPVEIKICDGVLKAREALVIKGKGMKKDEEMVENIRKSGTPFKEGSEKGYRC